MTTVTQEPSATFKCTYDTWVSLGQKVNGMTPYEKMLTAVYVSNHTKLSTPIYINGDKRLYGTPEMHFLEVLSLNCYLRIWYLTDEKLLAIRFLDGTEAFHKIDPYKISLRRHAYFVNRLVGSFLAIKAYSRINRSQPLGFPRYTTEEFHKYQVEHNYNNKELDSPRLNYISNGLYILPATASVFSITEWWYGLAYRDVSHAYHSQLKYYPGIWEPIGRIYARYL